MMTSSAFAGDLRYAYRPLLSRRGFSVIAVPALGLGVGVTTAIISLVDVVLFRPLPVERSTVSTCGHSLFGLTEATYFLATGNTQ